jgi:hypothetical protein
MVRQTVWLSVVTALAITTVSACRKAPAGAAAFTPGLGEIMTLTQMRHSKLWFAGQAGNWQLASYELDELNEGMEDAARFHPTHKDSPLPIPALIEKIMKDPIQQVEKAVGARDQSAFMQAFDQLTEACNACHRATNFGFNTVVRPGVNPYSNQAFEPAK